jgi:hypothetical protein
MQIRSGSCELTWQVAVCCGSGLLKGINTCIALQLDDCGQDVDTL